MVENNTYMHHSKTEEMMSEHATLNIIKPGTIIGDKYIVGKSIGSERFESTYIGWDTVLERKVEIKEYFPSGFAMSGEKSDQFAIDRQKIVEEAKRLVKFKSENGIVKIYDSFETNESVYIVMEYLEGETLAKFIHREGKVSPEKAVEMLMPIIEILKKVHEMGIIHAGIFPNNIFLTQKGQIKLINVWDIKYKRKYLQTDIIIKPNYDNYLAEELYRSRGKQGPYTDVYSVGAVLYKLITGETPPDALERTATFQSKGKDILKPIHKIVKNVPPNIETAIHNAMNVRIEDRTPDMINLAAELLSSTPVKLRGKRSIFKLLNIRMKRILQNMD